MVFESRLIRMARSFVPRTRLKFVRSYSTLSEQDPLDIQGQAMLGEAATRVVAIPVSLEACASDNAAHTNNPNE